MSDTSDNIYKLSVDNKLHTVNEKTLRRYKGSYFDELVGKYDDYDGSDVTQINRDGKHFEAILLHLEDCLDLDQGPIEDLLELLVEAEFYRLIELTKQITSHLKRRERGIDYLNNEDVGIFFTSKSALFSSLRFNNKPTFVVDFPYDMANFGKLYEELLAIKGAMKEFVAREFQLVMAVSMLKQQDEKQRLHFYNPKLEILS